MVPEVIEQVVNNETGVVIAAAPNALPVPGDVAVNAEWAGTNIIYVTSDDKQVVFTTHKLLTDRVPGNGPVAVRGDETIGADTEMAVTYSRTPVTPVTVDRADITAPVPAPRVYRTVETGAVVTANTNVPDDGY